MIQFYDRDAAVVAEILKLVVALRRANVGETYPDAAEALRWWGLSDIVEANLGMERALIDARLESIIAAIEDQLEDEAKSDPPLNLGSA